MYMCMYIYYTLKLKLLLKQKSYSHPSSMLFIMYIIKLLVKRYL